MEFTDYLRLVEYYVVAPDEEIPESLTLFRMYTGEPLLRQEFSALVAALSQIFVWRRCEES